MRKAVLLGALAGALGLALGGSSAVAAPVGGMAQQIESDSAVEKVHRRCSWHRGHMHCSRRHHHFRAGFLAFRPVYHCHRRFCHRHSR
jgi:hypothetical protein